MYSLRRINFFGVVAASLLGCDVGNGAVVDLSTWSPVIHGGLAGVAPGEIPNWTLTNAPVFDAVAQIAENSHNPSFFVSDFDASNIRVTGEFLVGPIQPFPDDDFIGFVFGFNTGDEINPSADYLLVDWKQTSTVENPGNPFGPPITPGAVGMALSRVQGVATPADFFSHTGSVTELQRAATLGNVGWVQNQPYNFSLEILNDQNRINLSVDGIQEISYQWNPAVTPYAGRVGFYSFSQADSRFRNVQVEAIAAVPEPSIFGLIVVGIVGMGFWRRRGR